MEQQDIKKSLKDLAEFLDKNENVKSIRVSFTINNTKAKSDKDK